MFFVALHHLQRSQAFLYSESKGIDESCNLSSDGSSRLHRRAALVEPRAKIWLPNPEAN